MNSKICFFLDSELGTQTYFYEVFEPDNVFGEANWKDLSEEERKKVYDRWLESKTSRGWYHSINGAFVEGVTYS